MIYNIFRCPHCGKETLQVTLGPCLVEDDDHAILDFHCTSCAWEHSLGDDETSPNLSAGVGPRLGYSTAAPGLN